jgi:hypothetical protein
MDRSKVKGKKNTDGIASKCGCKDTLDRKNEPTT